jgi:hypothetical protein
MGCMLIYCACSLSWRRVFSMRLVTLLLSSLLLSTTVALGQAKFQRCIIVTFESTYKESMHGKETYYWIISVDSLEKQKNISPLLIRSFSRNTLDSCCIGAPIAPFVMTTNSSFEFSTTHYKALDSLGVIVAKNRRLIQEQNTQWHSGQAHKLKVFATPVIGVFCSSKYDQKLDQATQYNGLVYIPLARFNSFNEFWNLPFAKRIEYDLSHTKFDIFRNLSRTAWSK